MARFSREGRTISQGTPKPEVEIDEDLIRGLVQDQHPDLASLELTHMDHGWDNAMYRLGDELRSGFRVESSVHR